MSLEEISKVSKVQKQEHCKGCAPDVLWKGKEAASIWEDVASEVGGKSWKLSQENVAEGQSEDLPSAPAER
jgi:hypothetical protein